MTTNAEAASVAANRAQPAVVPLTGERAGDLDLVGSKAANLVRAGRAGLPIVDGFVLTVDASPSAPIGSPEAHDELQRAWTELTNQGAHRLVVRSSSPNEDTEGTSMAGVFDSVIGVGGWPDFIAAIATVKASARDAPMAVLVQRHVDPRLGGVFFGVDPISGRTDRRVIATVAGGPWALVSGTISGRRLTVSPSGRVVDAGGDETPDLSAHDRQRLLRLARRAARLFGGPQDIEWAIDTDGTLLLLQSRPVTAVGARAQGPLLGAGPIAETFPEPLPRLAIDLWVPPLRTAIAEVLRLTGAASRHRLERSPLVTVVDSQVVVDLELVGGAPGRTGVLHRLDPRPAFRRLGAAWRVGRLRAALGSLASELVERVDRDLCALAPPGDLSDECLLDVLANIESYLVALHGHEMLAGALSEEDTPSGAAAALTALTSGRAAGWSDADIVARSPEVLGLLPPGLGDRGALPDAADLWTRRVVVGDLGPREQLRLRVRWVHELTRSVSQELGRRLADRRVIASSANVVDLTRTELRAAVRGEPIVVDVAAVRAPSAPLPAAFRLTSDGQVVAATAVAGAGEGAGGGRGVGAVAHTDPGQGDVLVVEHLTPDLAPVLRRLAGLVAETGSVLSHLAILARESGVPVVVGVPDARNRFPEGARIVVDGSNGQVDVVDVVGRDSTQEPLIR